MTISDRVFAKLDELKMSQKTFSCLTGIPQSTISDWRKKKTNPNSDKILIICKVLGVSPEWLLSGIETVGNRSNPQEWYAVDASTDTGHLISMFNKLDQKKQERLMGYAEALKGAE